MSGIIVRELECKVYLLKIIEYKYMQSRITEFIDHALCIDEDMRKLHEDNTSFKNYTYSGFMEIETYKIYKIGNIYTFRIRTTNEQIANYLKVQLPLQYNDTIKGLVCTSRMIPRRFITKLYSVTPVLVASDKGYWKNVMNISKYERLLFENAVKKYNSITNTKIDENFKLYDVLKSRIYTKMKIKRLNRTPTYDVFLDYLLDFLCICGMIQIQESLCYRLQITKI
jgi:CRISPR-associated endoribonuclease Cas6